MKLGVSDPMTLEVATILFRFKTAIAALTESDNEFKMETIT